MNVADLLAIERIACGVECGSKKRVLEKISELAVTALPGLTATEAFDSLLGRERLGSTGIGHGVAIPHGRLKGIDSSVGAFMQLVNGIDFDAIDGKQVDLLFALLVPEQSTEEHLQILSGLAEMFNDEEFCERLRAANTSETVLSLLRTWRPPG